MHFLPNWTFLSITTVCKLVVMIMYYITPPKKKEKKNKKKLQVLRYQTGKSGCFAFAWNQARECRSKVGSRNASVCRRL